MDVCKNLSNIVLDSIGIGYDVANGVISASTILVSTAKSFTSGAIEVYDNWNNQDVFYDASDTTQEIS